MNANLLTGSHSEFLKLNVLSLIIRQQLNKISNFCLNTSHSAHNLGFVFDEHLTFSDQMSSLSR